MCIDLLSDIGHTPYRYLMRGGRRRELSVERICKTTAAAALLAPASILFLGCFLAKTMFSCCDSPKPRKIEAALVAEPFQYVKITPEILKEELSSLRGRVDAFITSEKAMEKCLQNLERPHIYESLRDKLDSQLLVLNSDARNNFSYDRENCSQDLWKIVNSLREVSNATDRFLINYESKSALIYQRLLRDRQEFSRLHNAFCDAGLEFWKQAKKLADLANHAQVSSLAQAKLGRWPKRYY